MFCWRAIKPIYNQFKKKFITIQIFKLIILDLPKITYFVLLREKLNLINSAWQKLIYD